MATVTIDQLRIEEFEGDWTVGLNMLPSEQEALNIKGCPLGRGRTKNTAVKDLVNRIWNESQIPVLISND